MDQAVSAWSRPGAALLGLAMLAGCAEQSAGLFGSDAQNDRPNVALISAEMARGAVKLVPPDGFCIDRRGLRQDFAVLARCDSLGGVGGGRGAPLGFIAVSITPMAAPLTEGDADRLRGPGSATLARRVDDAATILHLSGPTPTGTDPRHWKGLVPVGAHAVAVSAFGPPGGRLAREEGGDLLASLARRTQAASADLELAPPKTGGFLSGLFD